MTKPISTWIYWKLIRNGVKNLGLESKRQISENVKTIGHNQIEGEMLMKCLGKDWLKLFTEVFIKVRSEIKVPEEEDSRKGTKCSTLTAVQSI